ncbi:MAG TPA: hypothetical protein VH560_12670 [Polyangia bacterium]|nr:hypothetical protein [Polyangia bacterium]
MATLACGKVTPATSDSDAGVTTPSGHDAAADAGPTVAVACADLAKAECQLRVTCTNKINATGAGVLRVFGTMQECLTREALQCTVTLAAPDSGHNTTKVEQCVAAYATFTCDDFFANSPPDTCRPTGARDNGGACDFGAQCKSGYCSNVKMALCGTCAAAPAAGASCATSDCARGQICDGTTTACKAPGKAGDACDSDDCGYALACSAAGVVATGSKTCQTTLNTLGASCSGTVSSSLCASVQGLYCAGVVATKTCVAQSFVSDGMPCGVVTGGYANCTAGSCYTDNGLAGSGQTGTCKADAADDSSCDTVTGPDCQLPARCVVKGGGTSGKCTVPTGTCG